MSGNEYVKFMTEQLVSYMNLSADEKKKRKTERKNQHKTLTNHWFGLFPLALQLVFRKTRH